MKYYYLKRDDGETVEIPEKYLEDTQKTNPSWKIQSVVDPLGEQIKETFQKERKLECPLCGKEYKTQKGLDKHKEKHQ